MVFEILVILFDVDAVPIRTESSFGGGAILSVKVFLVTWIFRDPDPPTVIGDADFKSDGKAVVMLP